MKGATLTRADLCEAVHEEVGFTRQDCAELVERTLELVAEALEDGRDSQTVRFRRLPGARQARPDGRNPKTGEPAEIEPRRVIGFRASPRDEGAGRPRLAVRAASALAKGPQAFRTISEAAEELGVPQHVLRFWETKFSFIRPMKRAGGRRFYRPQDIAVLAGVRRLLHGEGYTIKGVQRLHREQGMRRLVSAGEKARGSPPPPPGEIDDAHGRQLDDAARGRLLGALGDLEAVKRAARRAAEASVSHLVGNLAAGPLVGATGFEPATP
jgi:DNA-binding transcriptional MerR regulator/nucleoid DNA-binding protein